GALPLPPPPPPPAVLRAARGQDMPPPPPPRAAGRGAGQGEETGPVRALEPQAGAGAGARTGSGTGVSTGAGARAGARPGAGERRERAAGPDTDGAAGAGAVAGPAQKKLRVSAPPMAPGVTVRVQKAQHVAAPLPLAKAPSAPPQPWAPLTLPAGIGKLLGAGAEAGAGAGVGAKRAVMAAGSQYLAPYGEAGLTAALSWPPGRLRALVAERDPFDERLLVPVGAAKALRDACEKLKKAQKEGGPARELEALESAADAVEACFRQAASAVEDRAKGKTEKE
ncbi:unnamed protein product, partial [Discosporangium mesarthrocarpum]